MRPTIQSVLAAVGVSLAVMGTPVQAADTIYKWVDENGVTQYGSRPPRGEEDRAKLIQGKTFSQSRRPGSELYRDDAAGADASAAAGASAEATADEGGAEAAAEESGTGAADETIAAQEKEQADLEAKIKAHNCQKAQQTLKVLTENARVQVKEGDKMVFLTDAQMAERKKQAEQVAKDNCS